MKLLATLSILAFATAVSAGNAQDQDYGYNVAYDAWDDIDVTEVQATTISAKPANTLTSQPSVGDSEDDQRLNEIFNSYD